MRAHRPTEPADVRYVETRLDRYDRSVVHSAPFRHLQESDTISLASVRYGAQRA